MRHEVRNQRSLADAGFPADQAGPAPTSAYFAEQLAKCSQFALSAH
jgi:hypothetical protein